MSGEPKRSPGEERRRSGWAEALDLDRLVAWESAPEPDPEDEARRRAAIEDQAQEDVLFPWLGDDCMAGEG